MTGGSWPFMPAQCPRCAYLHEMTSFVDDSGFEVRGFCRHPRIAMELFVPRAERGVLREPCRMFVADDRSGSAT